MAMPSMRTEPIIMGERRERVLLLALAGETVILTVVFVLQERRGPKLGQIRSMCFLKMLTCFVMILTVTVIRMTVN